MTIDGKAVTPANDLRVVPGRVATIELRRPPNNYFDLELIEGLVRALKELAADRTCRAVVLCSEGKHFCAGADFRQPHATRGLARDGVDLYDVAVELFEQPLPIVAAIQGRAIGGGLGLALVADFRVATPETQFSANFARLGFHQGFGLSVTLPLVVGRQKALELLYTGRSVDGTAALDIGLCDRLAPQSVLRDVAASLAEDIASSAPLAVRAIRRTMRGHLADDVRAIVQHEKREQARLMKTEDWVEGVKASAQRRKPVFVGR